MKSLFKKKKKADGSSATPSPEPAPHPHAGQYRSETVERVPGTTTAPPQLVIGDRKPPVPPFGGEGLHANTVYEVRRRSPSPPARKPARKETVTAPAPAPVAAPSAAAPAPKAAPITSELEAAPEAPPSASASTSASTSAAAANAPPSSSSPSSSPGRSKNPFGAIGGLAKATANAAGGVVKSTANVAGGAVKATADVAGGAVKATAGGVGGVSDFAKKNLANVHERTEQRGAARGLRSGGAAAAAAALAKARQRAAAEAQLDDAPDPSEHRIELPSRPGIVVPSSFLLYAWLAGCALLALRFAHWLVERRQGKAGFEAGDDSPSPRSVALLWGAGPGALLGAALSLLYHRNRERSRLLRDVLNLTPGRKGLHAVLGGVPAWVSFQDREKAEWLNRMLGELWPYYDKAIAKAVRDAVEPLMEQYKPPGLIKRIYFKTLTFGDAPFRIENIWVEDEGEDHVLLEVAFRWAGEANIAIAIDLPAGGDFTRMVPKVTDLRVAGVARVLLSPLVKEIPGFGAASVALRKPPLIHFNLDFGAAFGGSYSAKAIRLWLDPFIRTTLTSMVVWPNRIVVPMLPESATGPLDHLYLRHQGLLVATIVQADGLRAMDRNGKSDPFVELDAQPAVVHATRVVPKTLSPVWNETKYVLIQEPKTQSLRVACYDHDAVNVKELLQVNVLKGVTSVLGSKSLIGRASFNVRDLEPGVTADEWFPLGLGEVGSEDGSGGGGAGAASREGRVRLKLTYFPWELLYSKARPAQCGAVLLTVKGASNLPTVSSSGAAPSCYAKVSLDGKDKTTRVARGTTDPEWAEKFEWVGVPAAESVLEVTVWEGSGLLLGATCLGMVEVDVASEVAAATVQPVLKTWYLEEVPADMGSNAKAAAANGASSSAINAGAPAAPAPPASVTLQIQWVPYDFDF